VSAIEKFYEEYDEWSRLEHHRMEFEITKKALDAYIPDGATVLDVGGGPGRYSIYLASKGHKVTLVDLSEKHVRQAQEFAREAGVTLAGAIQGNALDMDGLPLCESYDAVLCMGPLYHLHREEDRKRSLKQCLKRLKPGGILIASFISAYAPIIDSIKKFPEEIEAERASLLNYITDGRNYDGEGFTDAYFIRPDDVEPFMTSFQVTTLRFMATEGFGSLAEERLNQLNDGQFKAWVDTLYEIAHHRVVLGCCEHLLYIGRKG